jgi:F0F1-type ATP synthase assembly protein I
MADDPQSGPRAALGGLVKAESFMQLALAIPSGCFVGMLIGHLLDKHFKTHWMVIAGMLLGAAAGFVQIFQVAFKASKDGSR